MAAPKFPGDLAKLPGLPVFTGTGRPPTNKKRAPVRPTGPRHLRLGARPERLGKGPGEPPERFLTAHNSAEEWMVYWALFQKLAPQDDPRLEPFDGHGYFTYQKYESPTGLGSGIGRVPGGSVTDFAVTHGDSHVVIRLQTERFHIFADAQTIAKDFEIDIHLRGVKDVIDIYSQDFIHDESGEAVCKVVALALKGVEYLPPTGPRSAIRVRPPR